jgi:uncharacterized repeat protein (TIGR04138 family)
VGVSESELADDLLARVADGRGRFPASAYAFILAALERCQIRRPVRGHISGEELARACRDFALEEFGLTAGTVLSHWGLRQTRDIGIIVYDLIEAGLLVSQPEDRIEDFDDVFDFGDAFDRGYPWTGVQQNGGGR